MSYWATRISPFAANDLNKLRKVGTSSRGLLLARRSETSIFDGWMPKPLNIFEAPAFGFGHYFPHEIKLGDENRGKDVEGDILAPAIAQDGEQ